MLRIVTAAALESFEPEHRLRFVALFADDLARSHCSGIWEDRTCTRRGKIPKVFQLSDRPVRGGVAIQRDHPRSSVLLRCPGKEPLGGCDIPLSAQEKIDGAARFIHGAIEVDPLAFDLEVSLIHAPRVAHRPGVRLPTLIKIRHVALHPPQDRRMSQQDAALGHHLDQVTGALA
jgi:hypothetical protein